MALADALPLRMKPGPTFSITNDTGRGRDTYVTVDGEDISRAIHHLVVTADAWGATTVYLDPVVAHSVVRDDQPVRLVFGGKATRDLLVKFGWTPPPGDTD